jgi:hypothetical protein
MDKKQLPQAEVPRLFSTVAAIFLGVIAGAMAFRAYYGIEVVVGNFHVPMLMSWIAAGVIGIVAVFAFREA